MEQVDIRDARLSAIDWIMKASEEEVQKVLYFISSSAAPNEKWADLPTEVKESIARGQMDIRAGRTTPLADFKKRIGQEI